MPHIVGALVVIGFLIWGIVWFVMNFWPWIVGVGLTWLVVWFFWPDAMFWLKVGSISAMHQWVTRKADRICEDTIDDMNRAKEERL